MLPKKLTSGDQFKAVTVRTVNALIDYMCKHRVVAGKGITLNRYASGTIISAQGAGTGPAGASAEYDGYLKSIYYPKEKQYGLVCGFDPENEIAGYCWVNGQRRDVLKSTRVKPKEGFLCISGKIDSDQIGLEIKDQIPGKATGGSDTDYHPIALIKKTGENEHETFSCFQLSRYEFPQLWILGECEEDSEGD